MAENNSRNPRRRQRRQPKAKQLDLAQLVKKRFTRPEVDFKPDRDPSTWHKTLRLTRQQQLRLSKWGLYILTCILCLVVQDVVMSRLPLFGACTDLPVCAMLLITVIEGTEVGSLFILIASTLYYFTGSAPLAWSIGLLTFFGIGASLFRQMFWHRSRGSVLLCACIAVTAYELGLFIIAMGDELTTLSRIGAPLLTSLYCCLILIPMYSLIHRIGLIGGNTWKE